MPTREQERAMVDRERRFLIDSARANDWSVIAQRFGIVVSGTHEHDLRSAADRLFEKARALGIDVREDFVDDVLRGYLAPTPTPKPALGLAGIFANATSTTPKNDHGYKTQLVAKCPHCGAPQQHVLAFDCHYCGKPLYPSEPSQ